MTTIVVTQMAGIKGSDFPDFCDAFITAATKDGVPMGEHELNALNENSELVNAEAIKFYTDRND